MHPSDIKDVGPPLLERYVCQRLLLPCCSMQHNTMNRQIYTSWTPKGPGQSLMHELKVFVGWVADLEGAEHGEEGLGNDKAEEQVAEGGHGQAGGAGLQGLDL